MTVEPRARVEAHQRVAVALTVNGAPASVTVSPRMHLADVLREHLGLTGTHLGCEHGVCGMCTVLVDGAAARACLLLAVQCEGAEVVTVEGLGAPDEQHPLQRAFAAHHALQCGFCTPGMLISGYDLLANGAEGTAVAPERLPEEMSGVLCRCTGYRGILAALADVAAAHPSGIPAPANRPPRVLVPGRHPPRQGGLEDVECLESHPDAKETAAKETAGKETARHSEVVLPSGAPSAVVDVRGALSAPVDAVWRVLDDFERLAECLPGASLVEVLGDGRFLGRASIALGPVKLAFDGVAQLVEREPERHRLRVLARGADSGGSATQADVRLLATASADGGTELRAEAAVYLSGRIAQFGRALAGDVSRRMFERFVVAVDRAAAPGPMPAPRRSPLRRLIDFLRFRRRSKRSDTDSL